VKPVGVIVIAVNGEFSVDVHDVAEGEIAGVTIVNDWLTGVAAVKFAFPPWVAVSEQVPAATGVITKPETVQILVLLDANDTVKSDEAVGVTL
jgi:hypothetical protein